MTGQHPSIFPGSGEVSAICLVLWVDWEEPILARGQEMDNFEDLKHLGDIAGKDDSLLTKTDRAFHIQCGDVRRKRSSSDPGP
jgi:hypothetical protein